MNSVLKIFVLALTLGLALSGCMRKAESAKPEGTASTRTEPTAAASGEVKPTRPVAAGFDINKVPVVDPPLGQFPYVSLIEGYQPNRSDDNKDVAFDRYEFFDGA